jgi:hypothetical protein
MALTSKHLNFAINAPTGQRDMKTVTYLNKRIKTARDRARIKDYLLDMYLSEAEVEKAIKALNP